MKVTLLQLLALITVIQAAALPNDVTSLSVRSALLDVDSLVEESENHLEKRKGGGGKSGSSSSGSTSSSGSSGSSGSTSGSSSSGGRTSSGSGVSPSYGGGKYYGGGATVPYSAGSRSPLGIAPYFLILPGLAFAGAWAYGCYAYPYSHAYSFRNQSQPNNTTNTTLPVTCLCQQYNPCGCDDNTDDSYLASIVGNGSTNALNTTLAQVQNVNGTNTLLLNGTLPNGTTASGGTDSAAVSLNQGLLQTGGWWVVAGGVAYAVWLM